MCCWGFRWREVPDVLVQTFEPRQFFLVFDFLSTKVNILQLVELGNVGWNVLDPYRSRSDAPLVHQEQQRLRWCIPEPELRSEHVTDRLRYLGSSLVQKMLVACMERGRLTKHFLHHPIVRLDRVDEFLPICFVVDLQSRPPSCKLDLPAQLSSTRKHINFSPMATSFQHLTSNLHPVARIPDHVPIADIFQRLGSVYPAATLTDWKVGQNLSILLLSQGFLDYLANSSSVAQDLVDLGVEQSLPVSTSSRYAPVFHPGLIQGV